MSYWIYHQIYDENGNLFQTMREDGLIEIKRSERSGNDIAILDVKKTSPNFYQEILKEKEENGGTIPEEVKWNLDTFVDEQNNSTYESRNHCISFSTNRVFADAILEDISRLYPEKMFRFSLWGEGGHHFVSGCLNDGKYVTKDGTPYQNFLMVKESQIHEEAGSRFVKIPVITPGEVEKAHSENREPKTKFITIPLKDISIVPGESLGEMKREPDWYEGKVAILYDEVNPMLQVKDGNFDKEWSLKFIKEANEAARAEYAREASRIEFEMDLTNMEFRQSGYFEGDYYGIISVKVPEDVSEGGILKFTESLQNMKTDNNARIMDDKWVDQNENETDPPKKVRFSYERDFEKRCIVRTNGGWERTTMNMSKIRDYVQEAREMERSSLRSEEELESDRDER